MSDAQKQKQPDPIAASVATAKLVPGTFAGMPPTAQTLFAVINADGSTARGFQVASSQAFGNGFYEVIFSQDVTGCAYVATVGEAGSTGVPSPGQIVVIGRAGTPNGVFVATTDSAGNPEDHGFHIAIHC